MRDGDWEAKTMSECGIGKVASGLVVRRDQLPEILKEGVHYVDSTQGGSSDVRLRRNLVK